MTRPPVEVFTSHVRLDERETPRIVPEGKRRVLYVGPVRVAACDSRRALSDWAFAHGANEVRSGYDLTSDDE